MHWRISLRNVFTQDPTPCPGNRVAQLERGSVCPASMEHATPLMCWRTRRP